MKHFLVIETNQFFDPHGSPDKGGVKKFVTQNERYNLINQDACYPVSDAQDIVEDTEMSEEEVIESLKESEYNEEYLHAEDGYNLEVSTYDVKEITEEQAKHFEYIINEYNKI